MFTTHNSVTRKNMWEEVQKHAGLLPGYYCNYFIGCKIIWYIFFLLHRNHDSPRSISIKSLIWFTRERLTIWKVCFFQICFFSPFYCKSWFFFFLSVLQSAIATVCEKKIQVLDIKIHKSMKSMSVLVWKEIKDGSYCFQWVKAVHKRIHQQVKNNFLNLFPPLRHIFITIRANGLQNLAEHYLTSLEHPFLPKAPHYTHFQLIYFSCWTRAEQPHSIRKSLRNLFSGKQHI